MSTRSLFRWASIALTFAILGFVAFNAGLGIPGMKARALTQWKERLASDADLSKAGIEAWVRERTADARVIASYPSVITLASGGDDVDPRLADILERTRITYGYVSISIVDPSGRIIGGSVPESQIERTTTRCFSERRTVVELATDTTTPRAVIAAPIDSTSNGDQVGAVVLVADPSSWLYSFVLGNAIHSRTMQAFLVERKGGDDIGIISPLSRTDTAIRSSPSPSDFDAALAATRETREYVNYRGVEVLSATRQIEQTDWALVLEIDRADALSGYRAELKTRVIELFAGALAIIALGLVVTTLVRTRQNLKLSQTEARLDALFDRANDAIFFFDHRNKRIIRTNRTAEKLYGRPIDELVKMSASDLRHPAAREFLERDVHRIDSGDGMYETLHLHADGTALPVEVSATHLDLDGRPIVLSIVRDIRERKAAEAKINLLVRRLKTTGAVRELIIRERNREQLLDGICEIAIRDGEFAACWINKLEEDGTVPVAASAGSASAFFEVTDDASAELYHPVVLAAREQRSVIVDDHSTDTASESWRKRMEEVGFRSSIALPLMQHGKVVAVLNICSPDARAFQGEILSLVTEVALDVSLALEMIEQRVSLERARAQLVEAQSIAHVGSFEVNVETGKIELSSEAHRILGLTETDEWTADQLSQVVHPEHRELADKVASGEVSGLAVPQIRIVRPDGDERLIEMRFIDQRGDNGVLLRRTGTILDVTEREETLSRLRAFFEAAPIGTIHGDIHGRVLEANDEFLRIVGHSRRELEKGLVRWDDITPPAWAEADAAAIAEAIEQGSCKPYRKECVRPDGSRVPVVVGFALLPPAREESVAFILDLTMQLEAEESLIQLAGELEQRVRDRTKALEVTNAKLQEAMAVAQDLYDNAPVAYHSIDGDGRYVRVNNTELAWLGYSRDEIIGRPIFELLANDVDHARTALRNVKADGIVRDVEVEFVRKDGSHLPVVVNSIAIFDEDGKFLMTHSSMADDTRRREVVNELQDRNVELEEAVRQLEAFSYSVSHDLRAPLRAIDGFSRILDEEYAPKLDEEAKRLTSIIRRSAAEMSDLIGALLEFSRSSRQEMTKTECAMRRLAEQAVAQHRLPEECVQIALMPDISGDPKLISQVWTNLVANAVKFTAPKTDRMITIDAIEEPTRVIYRVRDNGVGFDMRYADKLFRVFHRLHSPREFEGSGIGLALVKRIIDRHGGETGAEGKPGEGAMFWFSLPK